MILSDKIFIYSLETLCVILSVYVQFTANKIYLPFFTGRIVLRYLPGGTPFLLRNTREK